MTGGMNKSQDVELQDALDVYLLAQRERFGDYAQYTKAHIEGDEAVITLPARPLADGTPSGMHTPIRARLETLLVLAHDLRTK